MFFQAFQRKPAAVEKKNTPKQQNKLSSVLSPNTSRIYLAVLFEYETCLLDS